MGTKYNYKPLGNDPEKIYEDEEFDSDDSDEWKAFMREHRTELPFNIRVIVLQPSQSPDADLECEIEHVNLSRLSDYDAISYVWGPPEFTHKLHVPSETSVISITPTLDSALRKCRRKEDTVRLWADAVCINQADRRELSSQVSRMSQIYTCARGIMVWLGHGDENMDRCIDFFWGLSSSRHEACATSERADASIHEEMYRFFGHTDVAPVKAFFTLPWFTRRWVVQEAVINPDTHFYAGNLDITSHAFHHAMHVLNMSSYDFDGTALDHIKKLELASENRGSRYGDEKEDEDENGETYLQGILDYLVSFNRPQCSDDHDRIYAYLGLADDISVPFNATMEMRYSRKHQGHIHIPVDYEAEVQDVYVDFAERMLINKSHLELLHCSAAFRQPSGKVHRFAQSWVPDWRYPMRYTPFMNVPWFHAGGRGVAAQPFLNHPWCSVGGFVFDRIDVHCKIPGLRTKHRGEQRVMPNIASLCRILGMHGKYPTGERIWQVLAMVFVADHALNPIIRKNYFSTWAADGGKLLKRDARERDMHTFLDWWVSDDEMPQSGLLRSGSDKMDMNHILKDISSKHYKSLHRSGMTGSFLKPSKTAGQWEPTSSKERSGWHSRIDEELEPYFMEFMKSFSDKTAAGKKPQSQKKLKGKQPQPRGRQRSAANRSSSKDRPKRSADDPLDCEWRYSSYGWVCIEPPIHLKNQERFAKLMHQTVRGRALFITSNGYIGLGPEDLKQGDAVAIFHGAKTPFVVREAAKDNQWSLIGDCYVHGIMSGEALEGQKEKNQAFIVI
jgi:hypothetical protein